MKKFLLSFAAMFVAILFVVAEIEAPSTNVVPGVNADADYTVNEAPAVKVGTQDQAGVVSIDVPANTACVTFSAGALKESGDVKVTVTNSSTQEKITTITVRCYDELTEGVNELTVDNGNAIYAVAFDEPIAEATTISLTAEKPFLIWNVVADPTAPYASKVTNKDFSMVKVTFPNAESVKIEELGMAMLYNGDEIIGEANDKSIKTNGNVLSIPFSIFEASDAKKKALKKSFYEHETFSGYHVYIYGGDLLIDGENTEEDIYIAIPVEGSEDEGEKSEDPTDYKVGADITSLAPATWEGQAGTYNEIAGSALASNTASIAAGNVLSQTISELKNGIYNVNIVAAGASASGMPTGDKLSVVFAGDKSKALPVVEGTKVAEDKATKVSLYAVVTDGKLTYGIKNLAAAGNWYAAKVESIRYVSESTEVQNVTIGDDIYAVYSQNLFVNGSFENGVEGWKAKDYVTAAEEKNFAITSTGGFDGGAYITTNAGNSSSEKTIRQSIAVVEGKSYLFTTYTSGKAPETNNYVYNALFQMTDVKTENGALKPFNWGDAESTTWTKTEYVFTAQEGNPYVGVRMGWNVNSSFDGFALVEVEKISSNEPKEPEITKIEDGDYFIYNTEAKAWLGGANSWGTQASLVEHPHRFTISANENGTYTIDSHAYNNVDNHYLSDGLYIDSPVYDWTIKAVENGYVFAVNEDNFVASVEGSTVLGTVNNINDAAATWILYTEADLLAAINNGESTDATFLIKGASISRNLYNDKIEKVWEGDAFGTGGANENFNAEKWGGNSQEFDVYQTISLPNGTYKLSANGFYRYNNTTDNTNDIAISSHADGTEEINTFLYANDAEVALKSIADDDAVAALTEAGKGVPFNQTEAGAAFDMGLYLNEVEVKVTDGTLKLGVKKTAHPGCDWSVWDNFVLTVVKLGVEPEEPVFKPLPFDPAGLTEIALSQSPEISDGANRAAVEKGEGYTKYTSGNDISVIIKMMDIDVANCDYVLVKFAAPTPEGINISFWNGTDNVAVPAGSTEYKYVFAEDAKCAINNGILPQVALITLWNGGKEVYLTGVYKHEKEIADGIDTVDAAAKANGKYIENGKVVIVKNGVKYNVAGARVK